MSGTKCESAGLREASVRTTRAPSELEEKVSNRTTNHREGSYDKEKVQVYWLCLSNILLVFWRYTRQLSIHTPAFSRTTELDTC